MPSGSKRTARCFRALLDPALLDALRAATNRRMGVGR
jgi:hypothetical protein